MLIKDIYENLDFEHGMMLNISFDKIPNAFPLHWHVFAEVLVSFDDEFELTVGLNTYEMRENDIAICFPGDLHAINYNGNSSFFIMQFPFELISNMREFNRIMYLLTQSRIVRFDREPETSVNMLKILRDIQTVYYSDVPFKEVLLYTKLLSFFVELGNDCLRVSPERVAGFIGGQSTDMITEACLYIMQNCHQPLDLETVAKHIGFSKYHFAHMFKKHVNMTFLEFLTIQRVKLAEKLLIRPEISVTEVAFRVGYTNFSTFNRTFKKNKGCSPSEFRNKMKHPG